MKFTVTFVALLSIATTALGKAEEAKDKREAPSSYPSSSSGYTSNYQSPLSQGDASSISIGAGYSIGGAKPSYTFGGQGSGAPLQLSSGSLQAGHGGSYQLPPITLQPNQDLSELMNQITKSLGSGALSLQPSNTVAEFHESQGQSGQEYSFPQFQQYVAPKVQQQYALAGQISGAPYYASGTKGLSSYGSTGPVLFNPSQDQSVKQPTFGYVPPSVAHSAGNAESLSLGGAHSLSGLSLGSSGQSLGAGQGSSGLTFGGSGHGLSSLGQTLGSAGLSFDGSGYTLGGAGQSANGAGHSLGNSGYSLGSLSSLGQSQGESGHSLGISGASGHSNEGSDASSQYLGGSDASGHGLGSSGISLGGSGYSFGGSGHSFGGSSPPSKHYKVLSSGGQYTSSKTTFKPSTFLGASIPSDSGSSASYSSSFPGYSSSSLGNSHGALSFGGQGPSFGSFSGYGGSSKLISPLYTKLEGSSYDSAGAYSSAGHLASPPGTSYGFPSSSYSGSIHASASGSPQFYVKSSKYPSSFGEGSSSYRSPSSSYSSLSSHSSGPKYSFGGRSLSSRYSPKDSDGAYSQTSYNTIKYSEELKPRAH